MSFLRKYSILLSLIPVLLSMALIFCFSAQVGEDSGALSGGLTYRVLCLVMPGFEELTQVEQAEQLSTVGFFVRKAGHFSEFALLGLTLMLHIRQILRRTVIKLPWLWAWGVGVLYAVSDEIHQIFVPGRGPAVRDVLIDSAGVAAGVFVMYFLLRRQIRSCNVCGAVV